MTAPRIPPHWLKENPFPWPEWERTCPNCGRYHNKWFVGGQDDYSCAFCGWKGLLPGTGAKESGGGE